MQRLVYILLLLLLPIQIMGKRDSLLWVGIKNAGIVFQQGTYDSVLVQAQRLLIIAESQEDVLAESQLHSLMGFVIKSKAINDRRCRSLTKVSLLERLISSCKKQRRRNTISITPSCCLHTPNFPPIIIKRIWRKE